jgi:hypothetical protein
MFFVCRMVACGLAPRADSKGSASELTSIRTGMFRQARHLAFPGIAISGAPICTRVEARIFRGHSVSGSPVFTIVGNRVFRGIAISGRPVATLVRDRLFEGISLSGSPIATLRGRHVFAGIAISGRPIATSPSSDVGVLVGAFLLVRASGN